MKSILPVRADDADSDARRLSYTPRATYRLQLRPGFGFDEIRKLIDHLDRLGISDLYLSPLFRAREDSSHGYDVVDHARVDPTFGDLATFRELASEAQNRGMGLLLDIVPNHMGINDPGNVLWSDVLENGIASRYSRYFDIYWRASEELHRVKVLLPFMGNRFGNVLEQGELRLLYEDGRLQIAYSDRRFPVAPSTWPPVLELALEHLILVGDVRAEFESIIAQLRHLPPSHDRSEPASRERYREQTVARRRLMTLAEASAGVRAALDAAVEAYCGTPEDPKSYDRLEALLEAQHYRLSYWRVAADEINYRRFFDINDLVAVRVEDPIVFETVHELTLRLLDEGIVTGLRVDHPDGLLDPVEYFARLQRARCRKERERGEAFTPPLYIVAEKILTGDEQLPLEWQVSGTTGYDFLNHLTHLLVDAAGVRQLREMYPKLAGVEMAARDVVYSSKQTILHDVMSSELTVLASHLHELATLDRASRDFTRPVLLRALREVIACFPVYRTYIRPQGWEVSADDQLRISTAVRWAKRRNPTMDWSAIDFVASVLLMQFPPHLSEDLKHEWRSFTLRFQQVTGPVTAKGYEDTTFYRYYPLASLNEVGGEVDAVGISPTEFHRLMHRRVEDWPQSLSATATHDTKRGEDVRARLDVLSEDPEAWSDLVDTCNSLTEYLLEQADDVQVPSLNVRYLLWQTLVGTWPLEELNDDAWKRYSTRIATYMEKALREAKISSSWLNPVPHYEEATTTFVKRVLAGVGEDDVTRKIDAFSRQIAGAGFVNSLAQVVLKAMAPGVPDFYQGCERWDFRLVDPDNRRPVDHHWAEAALAELYAEFATDPGALVQTLRDGWPDRLKLFVTWRALTLRKNIAEVFARGEYTPLAINGPHADHIVAFARGTGDDAVVVSTPRCVLRLPSSGISEADLASPRCFCGSVWSGNRVTLPGGGDWVNAFTNTAIKASDEGYTEVSEIFADLPVAILSRGVV
jgi:(1->4)-alpha-D-glucan 1-alpha-D-glucosylmutase